MPELLTISTENPLLDGKFDNSLSTTFDQVNMLNLPTLETASNRLLNSFTENRFLHKSIDPESSPINLSLHNPFLDVSVTNTVIDNSLTTFNSLLCSSYLLESKLTDAVDKTKLDNETSTRQSLLRPPAFGKFPSKTVPIQNVFLSKATTETHEQVDGLLEFSEAHKDIDESVDQEDIVEELVPEIEMALEEEIKEEIRDISLDEHFELQNGERKIDITQDKKMFLLNMISGSLISSPCYTNPNEPMRALLISAANEIVALDPEFVLKVGLYSRCDLNIRTTSNFILAFAALNVQCRPFLRKYFDVTIRLPSDFIEVVELYTSMTTKRSSKNRCPLPTALRKAMVEKFPDFDEYQLAKHNKAKKTNKKFVKGPKGQVKSKLPAITKLYDQPKESGLNLKKLIRQLHITKPAEYVMAIIGKKYPNDRVAFDKSGLAGIWDETRAGKRMKLTVPITWETQISSRGNKAQVWQDLLDEKKLPFMAMLRNLRNMIQAGISEDHHIVVLKRLQNERQVINSRQFPFRFFSAFEVLDDLLKELQTRETQQTSGVGSSPVRVKLRGRGRGRAIGQRMQREENKKLKVKPILYDEQLLNRYRKALDTALKIATVHNVKPIPGRTIVLCYVGSDMNIPCTGARGIGKARTSLEVAILLGLMCKYACEDCRLFVYTNNANITQVNLTPATILKNMETVLAVANRLNFVQFHENADEKLSNTLQSYTVDRIKIDNLLLMGACPQGSDDDQLLTHFLERYRMIVNPDTLYVNVNLSQVTKEGGPSQTLNDRNVYLRGYSDQILRFVAERGNSGQLTYVENIDKGYGLLVKPNVQVDRTKVAAAVQRMTPDLTLYRNVSSRFIRVFVSSTFVDMQAERNVLLRCVFPQLQRKLSEYSKENVTLCPVDLRWGVSEDHLTKYSSLEQCLEEVSRSDILIGLIGSRYGWCPPKEYLESLYTKWPDKYEWLMECFDQGLSVTALEILNFVKIYEEGVQKRAFFYFRNDKKKKHKSKAESDVKEQKLDEMKEEIISHSRHISNYCGVSGKSSDRNSGLVKLSKVVLKDLYQVCQELTREVDSDIHLASFDRQFSRQLLFVRQKLEENRVNRSFANSLVAETKKNKLLVVTGKQGTGKTAYMIYLASIQLSPIVIPCFGDPWNEQLTTVGIRNYLIAALNRILDLQDDSNIPTVWLDRLEKLSMLACRITFIFDGWSSDVLSPLFDSTSFNFQNIHFIVSTGVESPLSTVLHRFGAKQVTIPTLTVENRKQIIRVTLDKYGKKLNEEAFGNQMQLLVAKRQADQPEYLLLACEYLRLFANYNTLGSELRRLPSSTDGLIREVVKKVEQDHGKEIVSVLLGCIALSPCGLSEEDLYMLVSVAVTRIRSKYDSSLWSQVPILPRARFQYLFSAAQSLIGDSVQDRGLFHFRVDAVSVIVNKLYLKNSNERIFLNRLLADFACNRCCSTRALDFGRYAKIAMSAMIILGQWTQLYQLFFNLNFLQQCFRHNLTPQLIKSLYITGLNVPIKSLPDGGAELKFLSRFVTEKAEFLQKYPTLTLQEIFNQPSISDLDCFFECEEAENAIVWSNKPKHLSDCYRTQVIAPTAVTSVAISENEQRMAVGTFQGIVMICPIATTDTIHTFVGHSEAVLSLCFINEQGGLLCSGSKDTKIIVWDCDTKTRIAVLDRHTAAVSACCVFGWESHNPLLSASWDTTIRVWNTRNWQCKDEIKVGSGVNCIACRSDVPFVVVGCWDASLKLYHMAPIKRKAVMRGHNSAVRTVAFNKDGLQIISASMDGDIRVWSVEHGAQVGVFMGHSLPVTAMTELNNRIITVSEDTTVKIWSENLGVLTSAFQSQSIHSKATSVTLTSDGKRMATGFANGTVLIRSVENPDRVFWTRSWEPLVILRLEFIPDNILLIVLKTGVVAVQYERGSNEFILKSERCGLISNASYANGYLATTHESGALSVFSISDGRWKRISEIPPQTVAYQHEGYATDCSFAADAKLLASVGRDKHLIVWKVGKLLSPMSNLVAEAHTLIRNCHKDWITCVAWSDTKPWLVTGGNDCCVKVWDGEKYTLLGTYNYQVGPITCLSFKRGCIASSSTDGSVCVISARGGSLVTRLRRENVNDVVPLACELIVESGIERIEQNNDDFDWATEVEQQLTNEDNSNKESDKSTSPIELYKEAKLAASFDDGECMIWNPFMGSQESCEKSHSSEIVSVASGANTLLTGDKSGICKWWKLKQKNKDSSVNESHQSAVLVMAASDDEQFVASGSNDGEVILWSGQTMTLAFRSKIHKKSVTGMCWFNNETLITSSEDGFIELSAIVGLKLESEGSYDLKSPIAVLTSLNNDQLSVVLWNGQIQMIQLDTNGHMINNTVITKIDDPGVHAASQLNSTSFLLSLNGSFSQFSLDNVISDEIILIPGVSALETVTLNTVDLVIIVGTPDGHLYYAKDILEPKLLRSNAHSDRISQVVPLENEDFVSFCTVSYDHFVKIWKLKETGDESEFILQLIGCWRSPAKLSCARYMVNEYELWCGDTLGSVHRLYLNFDQ